MKQKFLNAKILLHLKEVWNLGIKEVLGLHFSNLAWKLSWGIIVVWICVPEIYLICIKAATSNFQNWISSHILSYSPRPQLLFQAITTVHIVCIAWLQEIKATEGSWNLSLWLCSPQLILHSILSPCPQCLWNILFVLFICTNTSQV
jgi:hypothetical protein